jgi:hypothetical protein
MKKIPSTLEPFVKERTGGVYNIRGISFQVYYTIWRLLSEFVKSTSQSKMFQLEGIEDLDIYNIYGEFVQIKCLNKPLDANMFAENILPNWIEVFIIEPQSRFTVITNEHVSSGQLSALKDGCNSNKKPSEKVFDFWANKVRSINSQLIDEQIHLFFSQIRFEHFKEVKLKTEILKNLVDNYDITQGNEHQFMQSLFYHVLEWSREKKEVYRVDIERVIINTIDEMSKGTVNEAIRYGWILPVAFEKKEYNNPEDNYFKGKAARPWHIVAGLPIERPKWEKEIINAIESFNVTIINASSGQGKSTLAWRVAHFLQMNEYSVFELFHIEEGNIYDLYLYIQSRLKIGLKPLIIIDGLNIRVSSWVELAVKLQELPFVKILITTRQEDWFRFGGTTSKLNLKAIKVELNEDEAKQLFNKSKSRSLIHSGISHWQIAWENVKDEKLLIEYIFILTQGQMIQERLAEQIRSMRNDPDLSIKKTILRLVSCADVFDFRIPTNKIIGYIQQEFGLQRDFDDILNSLRDEYLIQIKNKTFVAGLHPIRSMHLLQELHSATPLSNTLITMLSLINEKELFIFSSRAIELLSDIDERFSFLQALAKKTIRMSYQEVLELVYGVFASDAYMHWDENHSVYDQVANFGLKIYIALKAPYIGLKENDFEFIKDYNSEYEAILNEIKDPDMSKSNTFYFLQNLVSLSKGTSLNEETKGIGYLERWANRFNLSFGISNSLNLQYLYNSMHQLSLDELGKLLYSISLINESLYQDFFDNYQQAIITKLRIETNTLTIKVEDIRTLKIRYIVDQQQDINAQSVTRYNIICLCLPQFEQYDIKGIYFPHPYLKLLVKRHDASEKKLGKTTVDSFSLRSNQTWCNTIEQKYVFETYFEWQNHWVNFRTLMREWILTSCKILEYIMSNNSELKKQVKKWADISNRIYELRKNEKNIYYNEVIFQESKYENSIKRVRDWAFSARNVLEQFGQIEDENFCRLLQINAFNFMHRLKAMQESFEEIAKITGNYFDTEELKSVEPSCYNYFAQITNFYHENFYTNKSLVTNVKMAVKHHQISKWEEQYKILKLIKNEFENTTEYELVLPNKLIEKENHVKSLVLGIRGLTWQELERTMESILMSMQSLGVIHIDFLYLLLLDGNVVLKNKSIYFTQNYLQQLYANQVNNYEIPLITEISNELLEPFENILKVDELIEETKEELALSIEEKIWQYSLIEERTYKDNSEIKKWKTKLQSGLLNDIKGLLAKLIIWPDLHGYYSAKYNEISGTT